MALWTLFLNCYLEYCYKLFSHIFNGIYFFMYSPHQNMFQLRVVDHENYTLCLAHFFYYVPFLRNFVVCKGTCMHQNESCLTECRGYLQLPNSTNSIKYLQRRNVWTSTTSTVCIYVIHCAKYIHKNSNIIEMF